MIDTDKYEGMTYDNSTTSGIELEIAVQDLLAEVKRLQMMEKFYMSQWHNAVQLMRHAVREALNTRWSHKCPTCDELDIWFEDYVTKEDLKQFIIDRQNPESIYYEGEKND